MIDPFRRITTEVVVQPPFLVREVDPRPAVERHQQRMAALGVEIAVPQKESALNGMAAVALSFDQQESLIDALAGEYAAQHWADLEATLQETYPALRPALDALYGRGSLPAHELRRLVSLGLAQPAAGEDLRRALDFLYRAWELRQQVVIGGRPLSLIPAVGGDLQGDTPSFTPVLKRLAETTWQVGWPGDAAPASPLVFKAADVRQAMAQAHRTYSDWYGRDQQHTLARLRKQASGFPATLYLPVWAYSLRTEVLTFGLQGEVKLENISHNRLFRLAFPHSTGTLQTVFAAAAQEAVSLALTALGHDLPLSDYPTLAEVETAYLGLLGRRGAAARLEAVPPQPAHALPLSRVTIPNGYRISAPGQAITVAWVEHPRAVAVVSNAAHPVRGVLIFHEAARNLGAFPALPQAQKPDLKDPWQVTRLGGLPWPPAEPARRALSAWLAWLWQGKATLKKYGGGR